MQQADRATGLTVGLAAELGGVERRRVEAVVETLATLQSKGESLEEMAHDARNMVTALGLYCDLLEEPGVLAAPFVHYGNELRLVAAASRRLVEKLVAFDAHGAHDAHNAHDAHQTQGAAGFRGDRREVGRLLAAGDRLQRNRRWELMPAEPIESLAGELLANRNLLAALAGPSIALTVDAEGGVKPVRLTGEDLTRVLVNLVKNAAEAMPGGGRIQLSLSERAAGAESSGKSESGKAGPGKAESEMAGSLVLTIEDNGPGIPGTALDKVFESGYTTRAKGGSVDGGWAATHRGLGLAIARGIVEAAGGRIHAANRAQAGTCFEIELPVRGR